MGRTSEIREQLERIRERAELNLVGNVMPFWKGHTWDEEFGGFLTRLDRRGRRLDSSEKILMMQVRMIASLSMMHRHGVRAGGCLELADRGFDYLVNTFWDHEEGGFHFSVTRDGKPKCLRKNSDFHAYALTGLSEYYLASGRAEALAWADCVFDVLETRAGDGDLGYIEDFDGGDWPALNADQMNLGNQDAIKTIDMHTNMMEGLTCLAGASNAPRHLDALRRVTHLVRDRGIHPEYGCSITAFDRDWNPVPDARGTMTTSYGLNVEMAWLLLAAADVLQESRDRYAGVAVGLVDHALEFGFDWERGGLAACGPMTGNVIDATELPRERLLKPWWGQTELLNALIDLYERKRDPKYADALIRQFDWIWKYQIDHEYGDWYQEVQWDTGQPVTTDKGGEWKTAFHVSRALIRLSAGLNRILAADAPPAV